MTRSSLIFIPLAAALLAGCTPPVAEEPVLDGIPPAWTQIEQRLSDAPKLGRIDFHTNDTLQSFLTVDLTDGAIDSSVWIHDYSPRPPKITIVGYASEDELLTGSGRIEIKASLAHLNDAAPEITSIVFHDDDALQSQDITTVRSRLVTPLLDEDDTFGAFEAEITGSLCRDMGLSCVPFRATIDTQVDFREF